MTTEIQTQFPIPVHVSIVSTTKTRIVCDAARSVRLPKVTLFWEEGREETHTPPAFWQSAEAEGRIVHVT